MTNPRPMLTEHNNLRRPTAIDRRKPAKNKQLVPGDISRTLRYEVERIAIELLAEEHQQEFSRTIARRLGMTERAVDLALAALMAQYRCQAMTTRVGVLGAIGAGEEAARNVWEDR